MKTIVEKITEEVELDVKYHEGIVQRLKDSLGRKVAMGKRLEESFEASEVMFYGSRFTFSPETSAKAFEVTRKLLALFPEIERFSKQLDPSNGNWEWTGGFKGMVFVVKNATADVNCVPKQIVGTYKSWICERG